MNSQINKEMFSAYLYLDFANFYESKGLLGFANWYKVQAKEELELAREKVAKAIGANVNEIYFTSSATEANNWAIKSIARANRSRSRITLPVLVASLEPLILTVP